MAMKNWKADAQEESSIELWHFVEIFLKRFWLILLAAIIFGAGSFLYTKLCVTPMYKTDFSAYVNNRVNTEDKDTTNTGDLNASIGLTYLYNEIISSRAVLTEAAQLCGLGYSYGTLSGMVSTSMPEKAALIRVTVSASDPYVAVSFAQAITEVAPKHVARIVEGSSMQIVDSPIMPTAPYAPSVSRNVAVAAVIGFFLAYVAFAISEFFNDVVKSAEELEQRYEMVIVGRIPDMAHLEKGSRYKYKYRKYSYGKGYGKSL